MGTWTRVEGPYTGYSGNDLEIWTGVVTATGGSTITVAYSASVTAIYTGLAVQEFSASSGAATTWAIDSAAGHLQRFVDRRSPSPSPRRPGPASSTSATGRWPTPVSAGTTSGFTYSTTADADVVAYDTNVSAAVQPTATQSAGRPLRRRGGAHQGLVKLIRLNLLSP